MHKIKKYFERKDKEGFISLTTKILQISFPNFDVLKMCCKILHKEKNCIFCVTMYSIYILSSVETITANCLDE